MASFIKTRIINFKLVPIQCGQHFVNCCVYPDSDPTTILRAPWATLLRCYDAFGAPPTTRRPAACDASVTCFLDDLTALVSTYSKPVGDLGDLLQSATLPLHSMGTHNDQRPSASSGRFCLQTGTSLALQVYVIWYCKFWGLHYTEIFNLHGLVDIQSDEHVMNS